MFMELLLTRHAKVRMAEHAISREKIKEVIQKGAKVRQTEGLLSTYGCIAIAYKILPDGRYKIKTVIVK